VVDDPYKYFRVEARELLGGLNQNVLALEKGGETEAFVGRILRLTHTLKGAARVVKQPAIADLAHAIEEAFAPYRDGRRALAREHVNQVLGLLDAIAAKLAAIDPETAAPQPAAAKADGTVSTMRVETVHVETVRVEIEEMDTLLRSVSEAQVQLTGLRQHAQEIEHARHVVRAWLDAHRASAAAAMSQPLEALRSQLEALERSFIANVDQVARELAQVSDAATRVRLLPASTIFFVLERATRDAAQSLQKQVEFVAIGGQSRLDTHILAAVSDALLHVVRNAVAHGIEAASERIAAGKKPLGRVELQVERRGNRLAFVCRDDGRGIDVEAIRLAAIRQGLLPQTRGTIDIEEAVRLMSTSGFTTTGAANQVSGRGIGLDVVRETTARLAGDVKVSSEPGRGTTVEICVPITLSSLTALHLEVSGSVVSLPLDAVRRTLRVSEKELLTSADGQGLVYEGKVIPFLPLTTTLQKKMRAAGKERAWSTVVLDAGSGATAIGADRVIGISSVVVQPLPPRAETDPVIAGASFDGEGNPQLMLDPQALAASAGVRRRTSETEVTAIPARAPILVIDDSLTTRMLEQSILQSAGYEVELATSAEEGLSQARLRPHALFLVDVEMPGMSGFEFVAATQADPELSHTPAILVTSRNAPEDRRRGEQAGAHAYIVKGEFDQGYFLQTIRELIG
jgi:two-component system chemotaxis sensor kinase CheA